MKHTILILTFFLLTISGFSQNYKPIVKEDNSWSVVSGGYGDYSKVCNVKTNYYKFLGDTIIGAKEYKKVLFSQDFFKSWVLAGFIREDISSEKVWFRDLENIEGLIYDFNINLGSEVTLFNPEFHNTNTYEVTKIDSILIQSEYRRVYTLSISGWSEEWIEGIGSKFGILNSNLYGLLGGFRELLCFSNSNINYINPKFQTCYKTSFTPYITNQGINPAVLNQEYNFQITTTEVFSYDSISFSLNSGLLPDGLQFNKNTGLISGIPQETGTFHLVISIENNGYVTDYFIADLIVDFSTDLNTINSNQKFKIYPNPANDFLLFNSLDYNKVYSVKIYDLNSKLLSDKLINNSFEKLEINSLPTGVYFIKVQENNSKNIIFFDKLIISK